MSKSNAKRANKSQKFKSAASGESGTSNERLPLIIDPSDFPAAAGELAERLANSPSLFQRGATLVKLVKTVDGFSTRPVNVHDVVNHSHAVCRPLVEKVVRGEIVREPVTLPERVARLYLNRHDAWGARDLDGVCRAPLLSDDGCIRVARGYDPESRYWCTGVETLSIPENPSRRQAEEALSCLRSAFVTFPFRDAAMIMKPRGGASVDLSQPAGLDETTYLVAIMTAVCRPSLPLAPGFIIRAAHISGAGTGKGQLVRAIARIAYDFSPKAMTSSGDRVELDKRLTAALVVADPVIFLDNVNAETLRSNLLASTVTENPVAIRPFRENTRLISIVTNAFVVLTGNALGVSEDLARRLLVVDLDARCEDPEQRSFAPGFLSSINCMRRDLLAAALTIWRWGRRNRLKRGLPLGSFEQWSSWCRDPLLALGCADPVRRIAEIKRDDPRRTQVVEFFVAWHVLYGDRAVKVKELDIKLRQLADPHGHGSRQSLASFVADLAGTRANGYVMVRNNPVGKWGTSTYVLKKTES
jgi:hypothetical protein